MDNEIVIRGSSLRLFDLIRAFVPDSDITNIAKQLFVEDKKSSIIINI